jgi:hypothetical protein
MLGRRVLYCRTYGLEDVGKGHAQSQSTRDAGKLGLGLGADRQTERWPGGDMIQDRLQLEILVESAEGLDALLQTLGDRLLVCRIIGRTLSLGRNDRFCIDARQ